jgi:hypothetical protein
VNIPFTRVKISYGFLDILTARVKKPGLKPINRAINSYMEYQKGHTFTIPVASRNILLSQGRRQFYFFSPRAHDFKAPSMEFLILGTSFL